MIIDRFIEASDLALLEISLAIDEEHQGTGPEFFVQPGTVTKVYEDERGPVCFVRGASVLRLDIQWLDNNDSKRNMKVMLAGFPALVEKARENGFTEITFQSTSPLLRRFCIRHFGFVASDNELRKEL